MEMHLPPPGILPELDAFDLIESNEDVVEAKGNQSGIDMHYTIHGISTRGNWIWIFFVEK